MIPAEGRPYGKLQLWTVPTAGGEANLVTTLRMTRNLGLAISPDGKHVAFGGPYEETLADSDPETTHNPSNCYLWIVDLNTGEARNVSRDLEGDVNDGAYGTGGNSDFVWGDDGILRFTAFSFGTVLYCTYDPGRDELETRHLGTPGFANLAIPTDGKANVVAYRADHLEDYSNVDWYDLKRNRGGTLITLGEKLRRITTPNTKVVPFDYVNSDGVTIPGYLRYPAGYDDTKSYPMIVDTYGGVIGFGAGWMWTNSYFANRGYFDYIVVPRGASGYGQAFSDGHEGEWGATTSKDINQGVRAVISQIAGVDSTRVAWDSGSYGGFLAMYLLSMPKDDPNYFPYATAVGGYGISDIANYWGIGNWGQWYMEVSAPGKLPWSDPQWFIEHSPIYRADNITAPLLLVHGDADVNVPVGNSDEMYTALETLNRNVTFVRWPGEGHGTARDRKHYLERKRIEMEWFDKWLRDRPGAFEERIKDDMKK
jgi:dipeptidyl aminopeptidase/acylaminoacyl peptidase